MELFYTLYSKISSAFLLYFMAYSIILKKTYKTTQFLRGLFFHRVSSKGGKYQSRRPYIVLLSPEGQGQAVKDACCLPFFSQLTWPTLGLVVCSFKTKALWVVTQSAWLFYLQAEHPPGFTCAVCWAKEGTRDIQLQRCFSSTIRGFPGYQISSCGCHNMF